MKSKIFHPIVVLALMLFTQAAAKTNDPQDSDDYIEQQKSHLRLNSAMTPRTMDMTLTNAEGYLYDISNKDVYNPQIVEMASYIGNADGVFAKGLLIEFDVISSKGGRNDAVDYYIRAYYKNNGLACERLYWIYKDGELGQTRNDELAQHYHGLYLTLSGEKIGKERGYFISKEHQSALKLRSLQTDFEQGLIKEMSDQTPSYKKSSPEKRV